MGRVLVTGASKGIGNAIAQKLGERGWSVCVHFNSDPAGAEELKQKLGGQCSGLYQANLSRTEEAAGLIVRVEKDGSLDALVNNAGIYRPIDFASATEEEFLTNWKETYRVNLLAPLMLTRSAVASFSSRQGGKILNVASRVGFKGEAGASTYAVSKAALINLTRSLAVELSGKNIGVFGIAPGWVETAMVREGMNDRLEEVLSSLPLGRMASVNDCAAAAAFLLSDEASYLSGQVIDINGASYFH